MQFDWTAAAIVFATLLGPILAVEIQKQLEARREDRRRKESLFRTLMATRSVRLAPDHVQALNAIDLTFDGKDKQQEEIRRAWKAYLDLLNTPHTKMGEGVWNAEFDTKFIDLLFAMSQALGRNFDRTYLKNSWYRPQVHQDLEALTKELQQLLLGILKGEKALPVSVREDPPPAPPAGGLIRR